MTIATKNGAPIVKDGRIAGNCGCCDNCPADGKPRTDPKDEGTWTPSGTWRGVGGVTWTFAANSGDEGGETWFFYGSAATSRIGGRASTEERRDWGNICNWYSNKTTSPSSLTNLTTVLNKRANRLPPATAVVHIYTDVSTVIFGPATAKNIYLWSANHPIGSEIIATGPAHDSTGGSVFNGTSQSSGTVNGGATFNDTSINTSAEVTGAIVNGGATFNDSSFNAGTVNGGATFNDNSFNGDTVNGGATFNDSSFNESIGTVNGGATFNNSSFNDSSGTVNGGATFNDAACSRRTTGNFLASPCTRKFVAHPTDLPTCNGTARNGCFTPPATCGCG